MSDRIYRVLTLEDLEHVKNLRLEMLKNEETSFGSSYEEEAQFENSMWINRLSKVTTIHYGVFDAGELVAMALGVMSPRKKMKHVATINSVYVKPAYRGQGIGRQMMVDLINLLEQRGVERMKLSVMTSNPSAFKLYQSLGFETYGIEEGTVKVKGTYYDQYVMMRK